MHYTVDEQSQSVVLTERGFSDVEKILNVEDLFNPRDPWSPYIINALKAKSLFKKDVQYVKKGNEIMIVDEFTGRVLEGRRWSNGLHQSVEAKEAISPSAETQTIASVTYQSFFRQFPKLSGMSGTVRVGTPPPVPCQARPLNRGQARCPPANLACTLEQAQISTLGFGCC